MRILQNFKIAKALILLVILISSVKYVSAQIPVGIKHDLNGIPLNGYYDPLTYSPVNKITQVHYSDSYETGYYIDESGSKVHGMIKFEDKKIWFKEGENEYRNKIKPEEIQSFVIGVDSFFTISRYKYRNRLKLEPVYVQFISEFNGYTFARHYHFKQVVFSGQSPIVETILLKEKNNDTWENFYDNDEFKERALKYFSRIEYLRNKIASGDYESEDMMSAIKMAEYLQKYEDSKPILYDKYWQETRDPEKAEFLAKITEKKDSIWTFEYYKGLQKLYTANYSSFYPNVKNGDFIAYYPNGEIRQISTFENNKPGEIKLFSETGSLNKHYQYVVNKNKFSEETDFDLKYLFVSGSSGNNVIKTNGTSARSDYDELTKTTYTSVYKNDELISLYKLTVKDSVFQISNPDYFYDIKKLQKKFSSFMSDKKYDEALSVNAQGMILISVLVDKKGHVVQSTVLNKLHPELDRLADNFIKSSLSARGGTRHRFKPYKKDRKKRYCEVVIPIEFSINRFYRPPVNYYYFPHWQMHHMMMQQQMMNIQRPPSLPTGF